MLCLSAEVTFAAPNVIVFAEDNDNARQLQQRLAEELHQVGFPETALGNVVIEQNADQGEAAGSPEDLAIAIGPKALQRALSQSAARQVIAVMVTHAHADEMLVGPAARAGREIYAVVLDQPLARYLNLMQLALPKSQRVGVLLSQATTGQLRILEKLAAEKGLSISVAWIFEETRFIAQLERLLAKSDVLLALPDSTVHNRNTVQPLLLTTFRANVPVVAYSEAYRQAGALLSLYSTPIQMARQTAELAWQIGQGRKVQRQQAPRDYSVSINDTVARSLGLTIPSAAILRERLKRLPD